MSRPHTHAGTRMQSNRSYQVSKTGQASPDLVKAVRQLVGVAVSHLSSHPQSSCEEVMAHLPSTDESFYCYDLVRHLQGLISSHLSPLLTRRLGGLFLEGDGHMTAALLTDDILASAQYKQLHQAFSSDLGDTVEEMLDNSAYLSLSPTQTHPSSSLLSSSLSQATQYFSLDASLSSDLSHLLSQTTLWTPEQLLAIADDLCPSQPLQVRVEAMHHLLQFPMADLVAMETWPQLKPALSNTLMDSDATLAGLSLTLHHRLFSCHTSVTCHDAFLSLAQQLCGFFRGHEGIAVTMAMGVDPADDRSLALLQRINLLNQFQREVPSYWLRYNERTMEDIVNVTFDLLLLGYDTPTQLGPIHYLCLVDPQAQWFRQWTHGQYSRHVVLTALRHRQGVVKGVVSHVMSVRVHRHGHTLPKYTAHEAGFYNEQTLHCLHLCHCLSLLERLLLWEGGRQLFPVTMETEDTAVSISDILVHLLQLLYSLPPPSAPSTSDPWDHTHNVTSLDPALLILRLFHQLLSGSAGSRHLLTQEAVITSLISPIESLLNGQGEGPVVAMETLEWVGQLVGWLASSGSGRGTLLGSPAMLTVVTGFISHCLESDTPPVTSVVMTTWLFVCRQLYKTGAGLVAMEKYKIHSHIANRLQKMGIEEVRGQLSRCGFQLGRELVDNLLSVAWSPRGVALLVLSRQLGLCVEYMWQRMRQGQRVSWCDRHGYGSLVSQLASTYAGAKELVACGMVPSLLGDVWSCLEGEGRDGRRDERMVSPWTHPLDTTDHTLHKSLISLLNVISNFPVMYQLLNSEPSTSKTTPTMLTRLLSHLVLSDPSEPGDKQESLIGHLENHLVGLRVVSMVTTSLDTLLLLQDKFNLMEVLLGQQRAVAMENGSVAVDDCSMIRNRLLVAGHQLGGPSERLLPPVSLTLPDEDYPWPLFTNYPPPPCYHGSVSWKMDIDRDSVLYRLLSSGHTPSSNGEKVWLSEVREMFCEEVMERGTLPNDLVVVLLERVIKTQPVSAGKVADKEKPSPSSSVRERPSPSSSVRESGSEMIIRYGVRLGLLSAPISTHLPSLTSLLTRSQSLLTHHNRDPSPLPSFDWLAGIVFIMTRGNADSALSILSSLYAVSSASHDTCHYVEMILQTEAPQLLAAFQMSGCVPCQVVCHWLRQSFLNHLDWPQILLYLATTVVMGMDYKVYWCVCVLRSIEAAILLHSQWGDLLPHLLEEGELKAFRAGDWLEYMRQLHTTYRDTVLPGLSQVDVT